MIKDIANHMLTLGDKVVIIGRTYKPLESEGIVIGIKELLDPDTNKVTQRFRLKALEQIRMDIMMCVNHGLTHEVS